jgi:hypothetical protein
VPCSFLKFAIAIILQNAMNEEAMYRHLGKVGFDTWARRTSGEAWKPLFSLSKLWMFPFIKTTALSMLFRRLLDFFMQKRSDISFKSVGPTPSYIIINQKVWAKSLDGWALELILLSSITQILSEINWWESFQGSLDVVRDRSPLQRGC